MAIDFPDSPTDGQEFQGYYWDDSKQAWRSQSTNRGSVITSSTTPTGATAGDLWFNTVDGTMYVYYDDGITTQWVEVQANVDNYKTPSENYIINGDFEINQRNFNSSTSTNYGFDRWLANLTNGGATYSAQTFASGSASMIGQEARNFARIVTSGQSASNVATILQQPIENVRTLANQTITVSFWAKSGSGTPKIVAEFDQQFGTGGSPSSRVTTYAGEVNISTSWARYSITANIPSILGKSVGTDANSSYTTLLLWVSAGSNFNARTNSLGIQNNTFDIWGVQVEKGTIATPFRRNQPNIQAELSACQRYYQTSYPPGVALQGTTSPVDGANFISINTSDSGNGGPLFVPMRATPIFSLFSTNGGVASNTVRVGASGANLGVNLIGGTINNLPRLNLAGGLPGAGSVMNAHWVANAEL
jgi:hypothetical protein